jgi:hypothetical protein
VGEDGGPPHRKEIAAEGRDGWERRRGALITFNGFGREEKTRKKKKNEKKKTLGEVVAAAQKGREKTKAEKLRYAISKEFGPNR